MHPTASVLGHSSGNVTLGIYCHFVAGMQQAAVANIDAGSVLGPAGVDGRPDGSQVSPNDRCPSAVLQWQRANENSAIHSATERPGLMLTWADV